MEPSLHFNDELLRRAREKAALDGRSLSDQLEYWLQLGMAMDALLRPQEAEALLRHGPARRSLEEALAYADSDAGRNAMKAYLASLGHPLYGADPERPGGFVRVEPDGTRTRGRMAGRVFIPDEETR